MEDILAILNIILSRCVTGIIRGYELTCSAASTLLALRRVPV